MSRHPEARRSSAGRGISRSAGSNLFGGPFLISRDYFAGQGFLFVILKARVVCAPEGPLYSCRRGLTVTS